VLASSNGGAAVVFSAGVKNVWLDAPASQIAALLVSGNNLSDLANAATARTNLGLGAGDSPTFTGLTLTGAGQLLAANGAVGAPAWSFAAEPTSGLFRNGANVFQFVVGGATRFQFATSAVGFTIHNSHPLSWGSSGVLSPDVLLVREGNGQLAQRNGGVGQAFRIYNAFTDSSNYERALVGWESNAMVFGAEAAGTGSNARKTILRAMSGSTGIEFQFGGTVQWKMATGSNSALFPNANGTQDFGGAANQLKCVYSLVYNMRSAAADPVAGTDIAASGWVVWKNTNTGVVKLWANDGGVLKSVALA
jgi:hypothetical protein